ncbi:HD-GYP domain-containing protein [uncultured Methylobacterium sp.]|uniref:HD-GYP domain-containing protein n=1 Tax=uncultured Methylobacterium sp. TaxID=157278 RepID=UPI0035C9BCD3
MAQGAPSRAEQEPFVLLITDRPDARRPLARAIERVIACRTVGPGLSPVGGRPRLIVIDLDPSGVDRAYADAVVVRGGRLPSLVLRRDGPPSAPASPTLRSLPANAPQETILAGIFGMIEEDGLRARRLAARSASATGIVAEMFDSAALGAGLQQADADRGTEIVLEAVSEAGVGDWLATVWRYDTGVYQHTLGVAGYAAAFGSQIGLGRADHHRLAKAALLHDIGKSRIPSEILNKPAGLTPEEQRLMRRHPDIGADLLVAQGGFEPAIIDVVRHHHERIDGTGYPAGLSGSAIADLVRVVAICDVFSALTERRSYRDAIASSEALATMVRMRGHLDVALMRTFEPVARSGTFV